MTTQPYSFKLATNPQDIQSYFALRRAIFVEEQGVFTEQDLDELDAIAYPIIASKITSTTSYLSSATHHSTTEEVVGVVRIYEPEPGLWYGGRLGVHRDYRRVGQIGKGLIYKAVTTANTWGCTRFLATVQLQNVRFFRRLHWESLEEMMICDRPHHLMEVDLSYYPPGTEPRPCLAVQAKEAS